MKKWKGTAALWPWLRCETLVKNGSPLSLFESMQAQRTMNNGHRKRCRSYNTPGEAHELTFSCFWRLPLLSKDRSRQWFVEALDDAPRRRDFLVWAYLIMPEHVHVIVLRAFFSGLLLRAPFTGRPVVLPNDCRTLQWPTSSNPVH